MKRSEQINFRSRFFGAVCFVVILTITATAQIRSTLSGYVFGPQRNPLGEVVVELRNDVNSLVGRTRTDGTGRYYFTGVPNGRVSITVLPLGTNFEGQTQEIEVGTIGPRGLPVPDRAQLDFYLRTRDTGGNAQAEVVFAQDVPEDARRLFQTAIVDLEAKRTEEGIAGLKRAIQIFPMYFLALERLGGELVREEKFREAIGPFSSALTINPRSFSSWYGLSYANFALKNWSAAIDGATKALELEKNSVSALIILGISQRSLQKYEDAERTLLRAKKVDEGKTADLYWNLALLYAYNLKKYQDAADALELYLKANPEIPDTTNIRKLIKQLRENRPPS